MVLEVCDAPGRSTARGKHSLMITSPINQRGTTLTPQSCPRTAMHCTALHCTALHGTARHDTAHNRTEWHHTTPLHSGDHTTARHGTARYGRT